MDNIVTATEHYDLLIDEECDPLHDGEILKEYMKSMQEIVVLP